MTPSTLAPLLAMAFLSAFCALVGAAGPVAFQVVAACFRVDRPQERVFRTTEEWHAFRAAHGGGGSNGDAEVDFTRFMVAAHFDGTGSSCTGFTVEKVEEDEGGLRILATRHTSPRPCIDVVAYPQVIVAVPRRNGPVAFRITDASDDAPSQSGGCR